MAQRNEHRVRQIEYEGRPVQIVLQDENGPCPLLALCNLLLLRGVLHIHPDQSYVMADQLIQMLSERLLALQGEGANTNSEQTLQDVLTIFPRLQTGLDMNVRFTSIHDFEYTPELAVFDLLGIPLVHGWLLDPDSAEEQQVAAQIGHMSYNQLVPLCCLPSPSPWAAPRAWLDATQSQLTYAGLAALYMGLSPSQPLAVLFRNNHFAVLLRREGGLYLLLSDEGLCMLHPLAVWERLESVGGDNPLVDAHFGIPLSPSCAPQPTQQEGELLSTPHTSSSSSSSLKKSSNNNKNKTEKKKKESTTGSSPPSDCSLLS